VVVTIVRSKKASEEWLRNWCDSHDVPGYEEIIDGLLGNHEVDEEGYRRGIYHDGEYLISRGSSSSGSIPGEFWDHIEIVTGKKFERAIAFSCSC
jgi:hypothetical protein